MAAIPLELMPRIAAKVREWHRTYGRTAHPVLKMSSATLNVLCAEAGNDQQRVTVDEAIPFGQFTLEAK